ncbi:hypothetical protein ACWCRD_03000 [Streptomyces sp. NPDC002092]
MVSRRRQLPEGFKEYRADGRRRCWGRAKRTGLQCELWPMDGQTVCQKHGGKAPQSLRAAARRITEEKAAALVATYGLKIETTATDALLDEVKWTAGHVQWLRERVQEIESEAVGDGTDREHPLVWGITREKSGGEDRGTTEEAAPNVWLRLYQQERAHLVKVCEAAIRAGIEERRVRLAESQGALVAEVIRKILGDLQLTPDQQALVSQVVPRHLRALASD